MVRLQPRSTNLILLPPMTTPPPVQRRRTTIRLGSNFQVIWIPNHRLVYTERTSKYSTKFIVQLRHPVLWFQILLQLSVSMVISSEEQNDSEPGSEERHLPNPTRRRSDTPCHQPCLFAPKEPYWKLLDFRSCKGVSVFARKGVVILRNSVLVRSRAQFHHSLSRLGLTPPTDPHEWDLLDPITLGPLNQPRVPYSS
jgi:hypothetical protein